MIVYWVALTEILFYLWMTPVHVAVYLQAGDGFRVSSGSALFEKRFARKRALSGGGRRRSKGRSASSFGRVKMILRTSSALSGAGIVLRGRFSAGDAAGTAVLSGMIGTVEAALRVFIPKTQFALTPDFASSRSYAEIYGMISLRSGQIIHAALSGAFKNTNRRISQWISTRLKA